MANQNQPIAKIPKVRTYAKDLEITREAAGLAASEIKITGVSESVVNNKIPSPTTVPVPPRKIYKGPSIKVPIPPPTTKKEIVRQIPKKLTSFSSKNTTFLVDNEDAAEATIITDTKKDRFKLLPSIISSIKTWIENQKLAYQKKKIPKYTVPETTRRKGVIQKATSSTGRFATSDFSSIQDRIKQRKLEDDKPEPSVTWSANTEPGYHLLPSGQVSQVTNVIIEERKSFKYIPSPTVWGSEEKKAPLTEVKDEPAPVIIIAEEPIEESIPALVVQIPEEELVEELIPIIEEQIPEEEFAADTELLNEVEYVPEVAEAEKRSEARFKILSIDTNTLSLGVAGLVLAIIIFAGYVYFTFMAQPLTTAASIQTRTEEQILDIPSEVVILDNSSRALLVSLIESSRPQGVGKGSNLLFLNSRANNSVVSPSLILSILNINLEQNFAKSISTLGFGYTPSLKKFLIIKTTNSNSAKGGLLLWEESIRRDLFEIFDFEDSISPDIRFLDARLSGIDVRVLKNKTGAEEIIYGQIDNLVIITEDSTNFSELIKLKK